MTALTELYRFVEVGSTDPFSRNNNLFFVIDVSGSMAELVVGTRTRLDLVKEQMVKVLEQLDAIRAQRAITMHIGINAFSGTQNLLLERYNVDTAGINDLKAFVNALAAVGETPYNVFMQRIVEHYAEPTPGFRRAAFMITDGEPDAGSAELAAISGRDVIRRQGNYSKVNDNDVSLYGVAVAMFDTTYLAMLDNTPRDGIQAISISSGDGLYNALLTEDYEERLVWTYTNAPYAVTYNNETYVPAAVKHSEVESKQDVARADIDITFDLENEAAKRWLKDSIETVVSLIIWEQEDVDDGGETKVIWKGRLAGVKPSGVEIVLSFDSVFTSLQRPGLGARYQRMCRHLLYGRRCKVAKSNYAVAGIPTSVSGVTVVVPEAAGFPDGYFAMGMIELEDGTSRLITGHGGANLTLMRPMEALTRLFTNQGYGTSYGEAYGGLTITLYPGCPRDRGTCQNRFNNLPNYGGFDWIPTRNPFNGTSIV